MKSWLKFTLAVGLTGLWTIARAQETPAPPEPPQPTAPPAELRKAQGDVEVMARDQAARAYGDPARAGAEARRAATVRGYAIGMGGKKEKVAYIGIVSTRVTPALRENLNLPRGVGLVVETVEKDSPAGKAGLQQYDILQKLDDQMLIFPEQLGVLIRLHKAGDEVTLAVLRKGQSQTIKVTLGEKEMYVSSDGLQNANPFAVTGAPEAPFWVEGDGLKKKLLDLRQASGNSPANYIFQDGETTLEITRKDDSKHLKATDKDGKVLFDGDIDTDEQRKAIPEDIAKKLTKLEDRIKALPDANDGDVKVRVLER